MLPGLSSFFDSAKELFGSNYLVAGFLPVLLLALASSLAAAALFPGVSPFLATITADATLDVLLRWLGILAGVGLLGFVFWGLNGWMREVLEGSLLPGPVRALMEAVQADHRDGLRTKQDKLRRELVGFRKAAGFDPTTAVQSWETDAKKRKLWINRLSTARKEAERPPVFTYFFGRSQFTVRPTQPEAAVGELEAELHRLRWRRRLRRRVPFSDLKKIFERLERAERWGVATGDRKRVWDALGNELYDLARYGLRKTEAAFGRAEAERFYRFPDDQGNLGPTSVANMAERLRRYGEKRYEMDIDLVWPRMQGLLAADEHFAPILREAKTRLDFAVAMTWASGVYAVVWSVVAPFQTESVEQVALFVAPAVVLVWIFYQVVFRAYRGWSEVMCSAVDLYRLDLFTELHLKVPQKLSEERKAWIRWCQQARLMEGAGDDDEYIHSSPES